MPKPILPPVGTVPCPTGDHDALVKYSHNRRRLFGYCQQCGKFCEQDATWLHQRMTLDPEHLDKAPEGYQATIPPKPEPVDQEQPAPQEKPPESDSNSGGLFSWL